MTMHRSSRGKATEGSRDVAAMGEEVRDENPGNPTGGSSRVWVPPTVEETSGQPGAHEHERFLSQGSSENPAHAHLRFVKVLRWRD